MDKPALILPMSPMRAAGKIPEFKPSTSSSLPVLEKKTLPSLKESLPVLEKKTLPSLKESLPVLEKKTLPSAPISSKPFPSKTPLPMSPLAKDVKENREEIIQEITKDLEMKTSKKVPVLPMLPKTTLPVAPKEVKPAAVLPMSPRSSLPVAPKEVKPGLVLPMSPRSALEISQAGVKTALNIEPAAGFQPTLSLPFPSDIELPETLATISKTANLPSRPSPDRTPKIRIPKISSLAVKPSPKRTSVPKYTEGIALPTTSTVIPMIPITSPSVKTVKQVSAASTPSAEVLANIKNIDVTKLKTERVVKKGKDSAYNVAELKAIAGSLNLTKSGNKKDLIERIKKAILKVNPNAFD